MHSEMYNFIATLKFSLGICEIIGTFIGLWLILNTEQKWLYTSIFNIIASFISLSAHLIPPDGKYYIQFYLIKNL